MSCGAPRTSRSDIDWTVPVPGGTINARLIHSIDDMVQIKNPPQGYFQLQRKPET